MEQRVPPGGTVLTAVAYVDNARRWARLIEEDEAARAGLDLEDARPIVARRLGIFPGTLTRLRKKNGLKSISAYAYDRLNRAAAQAIERRLVQLQHELDLTRQQGLDARSDDYVATLETLVARAKRDLGLTDLPPGHRGDV